MLGYYDWLDEQARKQAERLMDPISRSAMIDLITQTNFMDDLARGNLVSAMDWPLVLWLFVGRDCHGDLYRIVPGPYGLIPDEHAGDLGDTLFCNVLGVNIDVQPEQPPCKRESTRSKRSTKSTESGDTDGQGFVFYQIGELEIRYTDDSHIENEDYDDAYWLQTGFHVVIRFGKTGDENGVYIVYDFHPEDDDGIRKRTTSETWGDLGRHEGHIALASIAVCFRQLSAKYEFNMTEVIPWPVELVRAKINQLGFIQRTTVSEETAMSFQQRR